jgi:hypothetical protein
MKRTFMAAAVAACFCMPAYAAPDPAVRESVAICDPNTPGNCVAPVSGGAPVVSVYNSAPPAPVSGAYAPLQGDSQADLKTYVASLGAGEDLTNNVLGTIPKPVTGATYSRSLDTSFGTLVTHNSKATAAQWFGALVSNTGASLAYLQAFNSTGSTAGTPVISIPVPAGSATAPSVLEVDDRLLGQNGLNFSIGLTWALSTTPGAYTAATASNFTVTLTYQ